MKKLMILGGSLPQLPYIKEANEKGITTIVLDKDPNAVGKEFASIFLNVDFKNERLVLAKANEYNIDGIISPGTDSSVVSSFVAEQKSLITPPYESCKIVSNKKLFRGHLIKNKFNCPGFISLNRKQFESFKVSEKLNTPVVVKPIQSMGARGTLLFEDKIDKEKILNEAFKYSDEILIEDFLSGPEISVDSFFYNGELNIIGFSDRTFFLSPHFIEKKHKMPSILSIDIKNEIYDLFIKMGESLNIKNGSMKADLKICNGEVYFIEIALRSSGKHFHEMVKHVYGTEPIRDIIDVYLGDKPKSYGKEAVYINPVFFGEEKAVFSIPGVVKSTNRIDSSFNMTSFGGDIYVLNDDIIYKINVDKNETTKIGSVNDALITSFKKGDEVFFPEDNSKIFGSVIEYGEKEDIEKNRKIVFYVRLEPNNKLTEEFINNTDFFMYKSNVRESDWHNVSFADSLTEILKHVDYKKIKGNKNFWKYFERGGIQGGLYYVDS